MIGAPDSAPRQKPLGLGAVEARMHAGDVVEQLSHADPARKHGDVGDERDLAHEPVAFAARILAEDPNRALARDEAEQGVECGALARSIGTYDAQDMSFFDCEIDAVQSDHGAIGLAKSTHLDAGHGISAPHRVALERRTGRGGLSSSSGLRPRR